MVLKHNSKEMPQNSSLMVWKVVEKATSLRFGKVVVVDNYHTKLSAFGPNKKPWRECFKIDNNASGI